MYSKVLVDLKLACNGRRSQLFAGSSAVIFIRRGGLRGIYAYNGGAVHLGLFTGIPTGTGPSIKDQKTNVPVMMRITRTSCISRHFVTVLRHCKGILPWQRSVCLHSFRSLHVQRWLRTFESIIRHCFRQKYIFDCIAFAFFPRGGLSHSDLQLSSRWIRGWHPRGCSKLIVLSIPRTAKRSKQLAKRP